MTVVERVAAPTGRSQTTGWLWMRWTVAALIWIVLTIAPPVVAATADLLRIQGFPFGFFLLAQGAPIALAAVGMWVSLWDRGVSGVAGGECDRIEGLALAMLIMSPGLVLFALMRVESDGFDALMLGHGIVSGLVLWLLLSGLPKDRSRPVSAQGEPATSTDERLSAPVGIAFLLTAALVPLVATHLFGAGILLDSILPARIEGLETMTFLAVATLLVALFLPARFIVALIGAGFLVLLAAMIAIAAILLPAAAPEAGLGTSGMAVPQVAYGPALAEIAKLERDLTVAGLADPVTTHQFARPWSSYSITNGILFALAAAVASAALMGAISTTARVPRSDLPIPAAAKRRAHQVRGTHWLLALVLLAVVTVPALAVSLKAFRYSEIEHGITRSAPPPWLETALRKGWAQMCDPPPATIKRRPEPETAELSAAAPGSDESPDWWLDDPSADPAASADSAASAASGSRSESQPARADDALVSRYLVANNLCRGPVPRLAVDDVSIQPLTIPVLAAAMAGTPPVIVQAMEFVVLAVLVLGLVGLLTLVRTMSASTSRSSWMPVGVVLPALLCVLSLALVRALPLLWVGPFDFPIWTIALLAAGVAPALAIRTTIRRSDSILVRAVPVLAGVIGFAVALAYLVLTSEMTVFMSTVMPQLSDAPSWKVDDLESLAAACLYGSPDACIAARALSREIANIAGLRPEAVGGLIGTVALFFGWLMVQNARQFRQRT